MPIRFWGQKSKVKVTAGNDPNISNISYIFEQISPKLGHICTWALDVLIRSKGQRFRSQQAMTQKNRVNKIYS